MNIDDKILEALIDAPINQVKSSFSHLNPDEFNIIQAAILKKKAQRSPLDFMEVASKGELMRAPHLELINEMLVRASEQQTFCIISLPVRHGKSFLSSEYFPAWYMGMHSNNNLLQISYNLETSTRFTSSAREIFTENSFLFDKEPKKGSDAKGLWAAEGFKGSVKASGFGASIIGWGGQVIICDDMYKDFEQAFSRNYNKKLKEWWSGSLFHRLEPSGSCILVLARWSEDDLAGWLLENARTNPKYPPFFEIKLPAIATEQNDPLGRSIGDALWPERYNVNQLEMQQAAVGPIVWACQFQQDPSANKDALFQINNWDTYPDLPIETAVEGKEGETYLKHGTEDEDKDWFYNPQAKIPSEVQLIRYWDLTAGGKHSDYLAGVLMSTGADGFIYIHDVVREKYTSSNAGVEIEAKLLQVSRLDDEFYDGRVQICMEMPSGGGKAQAENYSRTVLKDFDVKLVKKNGSKVSNALPLAGRQQINNVKIVRKRIGIGNYQAQGWNEEFIHEMSQMTIDDGETGAHDDQIDAASGAFNELRLKAARTTSGMALGSKGMARKLAPGATYGGTNLLQIPRSNRRRAGISPSKLRKKLNR